MSAYQQKESYIYQSVNAVTPPIYKAVAFGHKLAKSCTNSQFAKVLFSTISAQIQGAGHHLINPIFKIIAHVCDLFTILGETVLNAI